MQGRPPGPRCARGRAPRRPDGLRAEQPRPEVPDRSPGARPAQAASAATRSRPPAEDAAPRARRGRPALRAARAQPRDPFAVRSCRCASARACGCHGYRSQRRAAPSAHRLRLPASSQVEAARAEVRRRRPRRRWTPRESPRCPCVRLRRLGTPPRTLRAQPRPRLAAARRAATQPMRWHGASNRPCRARPTRSIRTAPAAPRPTHERATPAGRSPRAHTAKTACRAQSPTQSPTQNRTPPDLQPRRTPEPHAISRTAPPRATPSRRAPFASPRASCRLLSSESTRTYRRDASDPDFTALLQRRFFLRATVADESRTRDAGRQCQRRADFSACAARTR